MNSELTVLMTVYNGEPYLQAAMDSILNQTYSDFCFLIIDDASTDSTREIVRSYSDDRINLVCLKYNVGQTAALNLGLEQATTPWVARMDADDYSAPTRFEEQMNALKADPSLSCVGTHVWIFRNDPQVVETVMEPPLHHDEIKRELLRGTPLIHGSMVVSTAAMRGVGGYDDRYRLIADMELYDNLLPGYIAANVPELLLGVRRHSGQSSNSSLVLDENIDLCTRRLSSNNYSHDEAAIVRATLSRFHLFRARYWGSKYKIGQMGKDLIQALAISPKTFPKSCLTVFVISLMSERFRARLRGAMTRIVPSLARG